jgi:SAM-dependent methyltransferase
MTANDARYDRFPEGFFARFDESDDSRFYEPPRLVTHIDDAAIVSVGELYAELGIGPETTTLDLMSSWISHFIDGNAPRALTVLGMNPMELERNPQATSRVLHDLNAEPELPFADGTFDAAVCCVSVDYLVRPLEVFDSVARVLRPDGLFVCTFSNRCFPTKAIRGWLETDDETHCAIVATYFRLATGWSEPVAERRETAAGQDPLYAVWARRTTA